MIPSSLRYTVDDLELLPLPEGWRYELIDGELHVSRQPHLDHQFVTVLVAQAFGRWDPARLYGLLFVAPGVVFSRDEAVAPDLAWVARGRLERVAGADGKLHAAPDLAIELVSAGRDNERRDRDLKVKVYSRHAVREYWIVDYREPSIQVYRHVDGALLLAETLLAGDTLTSPLLPGFAHPVLDLCQLPR